MHRFFFYYFFNNIVVFGKEDVRAWNKKGAGYGHRATRLCAGRAGHEEPGGGMRGGVDASRRPLQPPARADARRPQLAARGQYLH